MNVGDYVRTKDGDIGIIINCPEKLKKGYGNWLWFETSYEQRPIRNEDIIKSSPQIIDLIEVGDFITYKQGNFYWNIFEQVSARYNRENQMTDLIVDNKPLNTVEILTVITHEQMEAMQYRVEK